MQRYDVREVVKDLLDYIGAVALDGFTEEPCSFQEGVKEILAKPWQADANEGARIIDRMGTRIEFERCMERLVDAGGYVESVRLGTLYDFMVSEEA